MNLYLIQHAAAKSKEQNPDRPLTTKGHTDISQVAAYVAENASIKLQRIIHSGKTRALQTAEVLAKTLQPTEGVTESPNLGATDDPAIWAKKLANGSENIMLVGHLPYLSKLAGLLICQDENEKIIDFQNAGVVNLAKEADEGWTIQWIITPQLIKA